MLVGTPGSHEIMKEDMGNVGRHTCISAGIEKKTWEILVGTPGFLQIMI